MHEVELQTPTDILTILQDPELRSYEYPKLISLGRRLISEFYDTDLRAQFLKLIEVRKIQIQMRQDPFEANYPNKNKPLLLDKPVHLFTQPNEQQFKLDVNVFSKGLLLPGQIGLGKSNALKHLIPQLIKVGSSVFIFDPKGTLIKAESFRDIPTLFLNWKELQLAPLQKPMSIDLRSWISTLVEVLGNNGNLIASKTLLLDSLVSLFMQNKQPIMSDWLTLINSIDARTSSRKNYYKDAIQLLLKEARHSLGEVIEYQESNLIEQLIKFRGAVSIQTSGLSPKMSTLLCSLIIMPIYIEREHNWLNL